MKMRQLDWLKHSVNKESVPWQYWSMTLLIISVFGTFFATVLLIFDGWVDALAVYLVSGLTLAVLLSRLSGQQKPHIKEPVDSGVQNSIDLRPGLILRQAPWDELNILHRASCPDVTVLPATISKATATD